MAESRDPSHPPAEPRPAALPSSADARGAAPIDDRPVRIQLFVALLLGLVLVATGLYLWRRPRAVADSAQSEPTISTDAESPSQGAVKLALAGDAGIAAAVAAQAAAETSGAGDVTLSEPRVVSCHDKGAKKTAPDECDHLGTVEQALARAIRQTSSCVPPAAGGGAVEYVLDVSFLRKSAPLKVLISRSGRTLKSKTASACRLAVSNNIRDVSLEGIAHNHQRYQVAMTATYPAVPPPAAAPSPSAPSASDTRR